MRLACGSLFVFFSALSPVLLGACSSKATCPLVVPASGATCSSRGLACEAMGGPHQICSTFFDCEDALDPHDPTKIAWKVTPPANGCSVNNDPQCPSDYNSVLLGKACPAAELSCDYSEGRCRCAPCTPTSSYPTGTGWQCRGWADPDIGNGCPSDRPQEGSKCDVNGTVCNYDSTCTVSFGPDLVCTDGAWEPRGGAPRTCGTPVCGISNG
jgi:hypothetical protein